MALQCDSQAAAALHGPGDLFPRHFLHSIFDHHLKVALADLRNAPRLHLIIQVTQILHILSSLCFASHFRTAGVDLKLSFVGGSADAAGLRARELVLPLEVVELLDEGCPEFVGIGAAQVGVHAVVLEILDLQKLDFLISLGLRILLEQEAGVPVGDDIVVEAVKDHHLAVEAVDQIQVAEVVFLELYVLVQVVHKHARNGGQGRLKDDSLHRVLGRAVQHGECAQAEPPQDDIRDAGLPFSPSQHQLYVFADRLLCDSVDLRTPVPSIVEDNELRTEDFSHAFHKEEGVVQVGGVAVSVHDGEGVCYVGRGDLDDWDTVAAVLQNLDFLHVAGRGLVDVLADDPVLAIDTLDGIFCIGWRILESRLLKMRRSMRRSSSPSRLMALIMKGISVYWLVSCISVCWLGSLSCG